MSALALLNLTLTLIVVAASPGPGVFATLASSMSAGFQTTLSLIAGIVAGHIIFLMLAVFGLSLMANAMGEFFFLVKILGGLYLIWLGVKIWVSRPVDPILEKTHPIPSHTGNYFKGLLVTFSNPKAILLYCGIFPTFLGLSRLNLFDLAKITFIVAMVFSLVLGGYALAASRARKLFSSSAARKKLNRAAGGVMIAAGTAIITKS